MRTVHITAQCETGAEGTEPLTDGYVIRAEEATLKR